MTLDAKSFAVGVAATLIVSFSLQWTRQKQKPRQRRRAISERQALPLMDSPDLDLRLLRKAEAVIQQRTTSLIIVVERCTNDHNYSAIIRTAEALGIQQVWLIDPTIEEGIITTSMTGKRIALTETELEQRRQHKMFAQKATEWIAVRDFGTTTECLQALRQGGWSVWATDLSQCAVPLEKKDLAASDNWPLPNKLAIVMGTEAVGCSQEMLDAADLRVYLPLRGFADSLNLSVASALVIHQVFLLEPGFKGDISEKEKHELRKVWFTKLAKQRLLTSAQKKARKRLEFNLQSCKKIQAKKDAGDHLVPEQLLKLREMTEHEEALQKFDEEHNMNSKAIDKSIEDLVLNPPAPLTDLRRADEHRVTYAGKGVKRHYAEHWKNMPATTKYSSPLLSTAAFFRDRFAVETKASESS